MVDYADSSQLNQWLFSSPEELNLCRAKANLKAREYLTSQQQQEKPPVDDFGCGFSARLAKNEEQPHSGTGPLENEKGHPYLTLEEEATLVSFYVSKLPSLIGPNAQNNRLRRESKVTATAAMLLRRFYLSNSVMLHDPKSIMVAAAFLGSKVEDATADVRHLEEGTSMMNAPVTQQEIIPAELSLLSGSHFDLLCFHPYKAILSLTEDLRMYLKSDKGKNLVDRPLSGQDLKPIYDTARTLLDDVIVSDIPLMFSPGQVGMAALMVAQEKQGLAIDLQGYISQRFDNPANRHLLTILPRICDMLRTLKDGHYGCANYGTDMIVLKGVHKKLKKTRVWGEKKKKRSADKQDSPPDSKRQKTS
jgi:cyclin H